MNEEQLKRLMDLVRRTGDTLIVTDPKGDEPVVLMDVARYEALVDMFAEDEVYAEDMPAPDMPPPEIMEEVPSDPPIEDAKPPFVPNEPQVEDVVPKEHRKEHQDDSEDDVSEEQFYLEPIE